jgi:ubiquinone/menaquinone biosynthesis C-methylase UbiE
MAKEYLKPTIGGTIVDASCGSGLFSRLFVKSGLFSQVIALDFSENMLRQCSEFVENENIPNEYTLTALLFVNFVYSVLLCF